MEKASNGFDGGVFLLDKPFGVSSSAFLNRFKRQAGVKKCGYAGTLDPFATGLLVCATGKATKLLHDINESDKVYTCVAKFGFETNSGDMEGQVIGTTNVIPSLEGIRNAIGLHFSGEIEQTPPVYSALKMDGKRMCDVARKGRVDFVELESIALKKTRVVKIYSFESSVIDDGFFSFRVECSKGTYIRKLIIDLAHAVGSLATITELRRLKVGNFDVSLATPIDSFNKENVSSFCVRQA